MTSRVTAPAGGDDVLLRVPPTLTASDAMLSGALKCAGLPQRQTEGIRERTGLAKPDGLRTVKTSAALGLEGARSQGSKMTGIHECLVVD